MDARGNHAKFQINILKNKKMIKLLELWTLWLKKGKKEKNKIQRSKELLEELKSYGTPFSLTLVFII